MSCESADAASEALTDALAGPKRVKSDAGEVEQYPLADRIAADKYLKSKCAGKSPSRGLRFTQLKPPGSA